MSELSNYLATTKRVGQEDCLPKCEEYLAHLPHIEGDPVETLSEHMELVLSYFQRLCLVHNIDIIVDRLLKRVNVGSKVGNYLKMLFVDTAAFHDFGKINENFQLLRMKNGKFRFNPKIGIKPLHGHSELGTFIFIVYHLEKIDASDFNDEQKVWLSVATMMLANSILLHHNGYMDKPPIQRIRQATLFNNLGALEKYLNEYRFSLPDVTQWYFSEIEAVESQFSTEYFSIWMLLRLNFSLLTASDYMATGHYMHDRKKDFYKFGTIDDVLRKRIIKNARSTETYNAEAFKLAEQTDYELVYPKYRDGEGVNLNLLRKEMAIEVIRSIRANSGNRLFYLEAPTGGGKTNLSMLITAELLDKNPELDKVFYVFPFTTLITQTHKAIKNTLGLDDDEIALLHSKIGFQSSKGKNEEDEDGLYGDEREDFINNLFVLYPVCLLTHIRFFDILKSNDKESIYLMHRLANSIVIIDELQSYSPSEWDKMLFFIHHYAEIFNIRFVLMSATLPKIDELNIPLKNRPAFVELLPDPKRYFTNPNFAERVSFNFDLLEDNREIQLDELAPIVYEKSKEYAERYGSVHTIIEFIFKKAASDFQPEIEKLEANGRFFDEIFILSGTILEPRRREVINFLKNKKNRSKNILLITTQVVEAGVDIDMDIGFKNISLIDSDEQLAGRVNRNVKKETCEVYLFKCNEPRVIYAKDTRWKVTKESISLETHREILKEKDFSQLYNEVLKKIDKKNEVKIYGTDKDFNTYHNHIERLDFREIDRNFKLIDQKNISVFVPLDLPINVAGTDDDKETLEAIFSKKELDFMEKAGTWRKEKYVSGAAVWQLYRDVLGRKKEDFVRQKVDLKVMQGILAKFTFSLFDNPAMQSKLIHFHNEEEDISDYWYLTPHNNIFSFQEGLKMSELDNPDNFII